MKDVVWSNDALDDLDALADHIATDNPRAALLVLERIDETVENLRHIPTGRRGRVAGTYEKAVRHLPYIIVYALTPLRRGDEQIVVLRVIHGAREWLKDEWPK